MIISLEGKIKRDKHEQFFPILTCWMASSSTRLLPISKGSVPLHCFRIKKHDFIAIIFRLDCIFIYNFIKTAPSTKYIHITSNHRSCMKISAHWWRALHTLIQSDLKQENMQKYIQRLKTNPLSFLLLEFIFDSGN